MSKLFRWLGERAVLIVVSCICAVVLSTALQYGVSREATLSVSSKDGLDALRIPVQAALEEQGYTLSDDVPIAMLPLPKEAGTFQWSVPFLSPDEPRSFAAIAQATPRGQSAPDLVRVTVERASASSHTPIRVGSPFNITRSRDASENIESQQGTVLVISSWVAGRCLQLSTLDVSGEPSALTVAWSSLDRFKNQVSMWQTVGQSIGVTRHDLLFSQPPSTLFVEPVVPATRPPSFRVGFEAATPLWTVEVNSASVHPPTPKPLRKDVQVLAREDLTKGNPGNLGWFVDTVRDISWVGPRKIAVAEHIAFDLLDVLKRTRVSLFGPGQSSAPTLAASNTSASAPQTPPPDPSAQWAFPAERHAQRIWPPTPAKPILDPPGEGEGQWVPMTSLVKASHDRVPYFYQSWLRPDPSRPFAVMSVTAWDSSRVQLGFVAGTREPTGTTGMKGTGLIPRRPGLMPSVVAAFNGGFQTKHGAYGMVVEDRVLLPPVGGGASVVRTRDARAFLGTWPTDPKADAPRPGRLPEGVAIPKDIFSVRQNLQPLIDNGVINPTGRAKWGGTAGIGTDSTHTTRTGICLMKGTTLAYFYGNSVDADAVGRVMIAFGCEYGVHLDMNAGHSGFEFYNIQDEEGTDFKASRMIQKMGHMKYPRYVKRDVRDYFYLTLAKQPAQRLEALSSSVWRRPFPVQDQSPVMVDLPPAEVLETNMPLAEDLTAHVVRFPRARLRASTERVLTTTPPPLDDPSASLVAFVHIPQKAHGHLVLSPSAQFGLLKDQAGSPGTTIPVEILAREGRVLKHSPPEPPPAGAETAPQTLHSTYILLAFSETDTFALHIHGSSPDRAVPALLKLGARDVVALPLESQNTSLSLRFQNSKGDALIAPAIRAKVEGTERLVFHLSGRTSPTGRVEDLFPKPPETTPTP